MPPSVVLSQSPPDKSGVKSTVISLPSGAGSIEGLGESFEPQLNTGGSTYGISVTVPPGRAGLAPTVRVGYNSYGGNSVCGLGWSLDFMTIKRQTDKGFPEYDSQDTFIFQGEELVPLNNTEKDWRCENERSFMRLRRIDGDGDGVLDAWEVTERDGTRHTLGRFRGQSNQWSAVEHPEKLELGPFDRTYAWMLDSTTDPHGNRIDYEYEQGFGTLYPSRIAYGHLNGNVHQVLFQYETRPDVFDDYRPTFSARLDRRLTRIEVRSRGNLVRAYNFVYDYAAGDLTPDVAARQSTYLDLGMTMLKRVVQVDRSGNDANYLPPLIFLYSGLDLTRSERRGLAAPPDLDLADPDGRVQLADLDGDALPDLFATTAEGAGQAQRVALNRGESRASGQPLLSFAPARLVVGASPIDLAEPSTVVHDPKGKGLVDVSSLTEDGLNKRLETFGNRARLDLVDENRLGFSQDNLEFTILQNPPAFVTYSHAGTRQMDANFDKRGDFVKLEPSFGSMKVLAYYVNRQGQWVLRESTLPSSYPLANTFDSPDGMPNPCVHLADMNGDRLLDLVCLSPEPSGGGQRLTVKFWLLRGLGRYSEEQVLPTAEGDMFEIGAADLRDVFIDDITGDGLADVLVLDGSGPETMLSLRVNIAGKRWSPPYTRKGLPRYAPRDPVAPTVVRLADLNANGSLDFLFRNGGLEDSWEYIELLPDGIPSLMIGIDNGLGKRTTITYGAAAEDEQIARQSGSPWRTFAPMPLQVVRQIRSTSGQDMNGDGQEDAVVMDFRYRDPYYDGFEREFRGFAFAQRVDYGDDFLLDPVTGLMKTSPGWDQDRTPTGQVSGPSLVRRYRFYTGAADQRDNDNYAPGDTGGRQTDEFTVMGGREEEILKGLQRVEEQVDPVVLHGAPGGDFDAGCLAATQAATEEAQTKLTPDDYVYARIRQEWTLRRLYRPTEALPYLADQDADGVMEDYREAPAVAVPSGRFGSRDLHVLPGIGRSVSFAFVSRRACEVREANGLLSVDLGHLKVAPVHTAKDFDYDDYGNQILMRDWGADDPAYDDELVTTVTYALSGQALSLWMIDRPDTILVTDEQGAFVARTDHYYDGVPLVGIQGQVQDRGRLHRAVDYVDATRTIQRTRARFDAFGNIIETHDPRGNIRKIEWDPLFQTHAIAETMVVGGGSPDLRIEVDLDPAFGVVTTSRDVNGNTTTYHYDSFARLVKVVGPGDTPELPTSLYEYQPADPIRGRGFLYDETGRLTIISVPEGSVSRVITRQREVSGQPGQFISANYTDGSGTALATVEEGETAGTWVVREATSYNLRGMEQAKWLPYQVAGADVPQFPALWPAGRPPLTDGINPSIPATRHFYDPQGRTIRILPPPESWSGPSRQTVTQHLPLKKRFFDEEDLREGSPHAGTPRLESFDGLGRLVAVDEIVRINDDGSPANDLRIWTTRYEYDLNHQVTRITDAQNNVKVMKYDGLKRKIYMNDPDSGEMTYLYDDASNLIETTDAKGQRITYTYDGLNRILSEDYHDEASPEFRYNRSPDVAYFYDQPAGPIDLGDGARATARHTKGLLASVVDASGEEHNSYDARGRLEWTVKRLREPGAASPEAWASYATRYEYDAMDRVTRMIYPDNDQVAYRYNARNLIQSIGGGPGREIISAVQYQPSAQISRIDYGNGVRTRYYYDPRLRMTNLLTVSQNISGSPKLIDLAYAFDGISNIKSIEDRRHPSWVSQEDGRRNSQQFTYDDLYRLTHARYHLPGATASQGGSIHYRYDRLGNMLAQTSDIQHLAEDRTLTDPGALRYGGTGGTTNRLGRPANSPPGPHALTSIQHSQFEDRTFLYDANGNMVRMDGLACTWDFKDRLVKVEDDSTRAEYIYDYTGRRVLKRVTWKSGPAESNTTAVIYIGAHFEVRENEQPIKYVFNGSTRVARVTGSLSDRSRIQRFTLHSGWNLLSLAITVSNALERINRSDLANSGIIRTDHINRWDAAAQTWAPLRPEDHLPSGTAVWIYALTNAILSLHGGYADPVESPIEPGGMFFAQTGLEAWPMDTWREAELWHFDASIQRWRSRLPALAGVDDGFPEFLPPGQVLFIKAETVQEPERLDETLQIRYYHQDHLGSSSVLTDAAGELVEETAYYPFGVSRHEYQPRHLKEAYRFNQKELDQESGLYCYEARYLAGSLSRFISVDPKFSNPDRLSGDELNDFFANPQKLNGYSYVLNNPLKYADPTGLEPEEKTGALDYAEKAVDIGGFRADWGEFRGNAKWKGPGLVMDVIGISIKVVKFADEPSLYNGASAVYEGGKTAITTYAPPIGLTLQAMDLAGIGPGSVLDWGNEVATQIHENAATWKRVAQTYKEVEKSYEELGRMYKEETRMLQEETRRLQEQTRQIREQIRKTDEILRKTDEVLKKYRK